jgi:hypothetical protein
MSRSKKAFYVFGGIACFAIAAANFLETKGTSRIVALFTIAGVAAIMAIQEFFRGGKSN